MKYPIQLRFKKVTLTNEMRVIDADGQSVAYVRQKLLKFKEEIVVYKDQTKQQLLYTIKADKIIDWSPTYTLYDPDGQPRASAKRAGAKSLFKATYDLSIRQQHVGTLKEHNGWIKFLDALVGAFWFIDIFTGYFINPSYDFIFADGRVAATLTKRPAFLEGFYVIESDTLATYQEEDQLYITLLLMLAATMERYRG